MSTPKTDTAASSPPAAPQAGLVDQVAAELAERLQAVTDELKQLERERLEPLREEQRRLQAAVRALED